jgi:3',5'-cyclic AMP phosphodiesterase CpdA
VLEALLADLAVQGPDHVAVTGDIVNIGLPQEHERAARWLARLGDPKAVTVVPGNHDCYVRLRRDPGIMRWAAHMASNREGSCLMAEATIGVTGADGAFPFVRCLGRYALIGLSSAVPTPPFIASGRLGKDQIAALASLLARLGKAGFCRIVLIHHPPLPGQAGRYRGLDDAGALSDVLAAEGAELVLHGHLHRSMLAHLDGPQGPIPVVGVPSASAGLPDHAPPGRYNLFGFEPCGERWLIRMTGRQWAGAEGGIETVEQILLGA